MFADLYQWVWLAWQIILAVLSVGAVERLPPLRASAVALAGLLPFIALMVVFIR